MQELDWEADGAVVARQLIPEPDIDKYLDFFHETYVGAGESARDDDYLKFPEVRDLACHKAISDTFDRIGLVGHVEFCLLGWEYNPIGWHADLMPGSTRTAGVIIALDDLDPRSGLFEMIPGSHRWDVDLFQCHPADDGTTKEYVAEQIADHLDAVYRFEASKGDVLIWDSQLIHRRSPRTADVPRQTVVTLCKLPRWESRQHKDGLGFIADF